MPGEPGSADLQIGCSAGLQAHALFGSVSPTTDNRPGPECPHKRAFRLRGPYPTTDNRQLLPKRKRDKRLYPAACPFSQTQYQHYNTFMSNNSALKCTPIPEMETPPFADFLTSKILAVILLYLLSTKVRFSYRQLTANPNFAPLQLGGPGLVVFETWVSAVLHCGKVVTSRDFSLWALHSFSRTVPLS